MNPHVYSEKRWEYRKGKKATARRDDRIGHRIRTTGKSIKVPDCYSVVLIRHVSWAQWFWGGGYSAKREVSIGRFGLIRWFSIKIEHARVRVQCVLSDTFDVRVQKRKEMKRWFYWSRLVIYFASFFRISSQSFHNIAIDIVTVLNGATDFVGTHQ